MARSKDVAVKALVDATMDRFNTWNPRFDVDDFKFGFNKTKKVTIPPNVKA